MSLLSLIPFPYRLLALACLAIALFGFGWVKGAEHGEARLEAVKAKWDTERASLAKAVQDQRAANAQREADIQVKYVTQTVVRDRFITQTIPEVHDATANLGACRLTPDAVRLLNSARECAGQDRRASCGADQQVRDSRPAS